MRASFGSLIHCGHQNGADLVVVNGGVSLGGGDRRVTGEHLDGTQVAATAGGDACSYTSLSGDRAVRSKDDASVTAAIRTSVDEARAGRWYDVGVGVGWCDGHGAYLSL